MNITGSIACRTAAISRPEMSSASSMTISRQRTRHAAICSTARIDSLWSKFVIESIVEKFFCRNRSLIACASLA